jgi:hypothetical protein
VTDADLAAQLADAQHRFELASEALRAKHSATELEEWRAASEACLAAERALSLARGDETAVLCKWAVAWDLGAPLPHVVASGAGAYLLYLASEPDPNWDGTYVTVVDPARSTPMPIAVVEFIGCDALMFGGPNDEVFEGHPLSGKGLGSYGAYLVENSRWRAELEQINAIHPLYDPEKWIDLKHYLLLFHDEMFECIARGHRIEVFRASFDAVLRSVTDRLLRRGQA